MKAKLIGGYVAIAGSAFAAAIVLGWLIGPRIDNYAYDTMLRRKAPAPAASQSVIVAIDDDTLNTMGGVRNLRTILAAGLESIGGADIVTRLDRGEGGRRSGHSGRH